MKTIPALTNLSSTLPSSVIENLLHLAIHSKNTSVQEITRELLKSQQQIPKVREFFDYIQDLQSIHKSPSSSNHTNRLIAMISSKNENEIHTAFNIVQRMMLIEKKAPINLLHAVASQINKHNDITTEILITGMKNGNLLDQTICRLIEESFLTCRTEMMVVLIRMLAVEQIELHPKTLNGLLEILNDETVGKTTYNDAIIALQHIARHQQLSQEIISYCTNQLLNESKDTIQACLSIIRHQHLQGHINNISDSLFLSQAVRITNDNILCEPKTIEHYLGTIQTLLFVDHFDLTVFQMPGERWSRECLCVDLLARYPNKTSEQTLAFYHQLTVLEQSKQYGLFSDDRDTILRAIICKQRTDLIDLFTINQVLIYLNVPSDAAIKILLSNESTWLVSIRRRFIQHKTNEYFLNFECSKAAIDYLVDRISKQDHLSAELIESFLQSVRTPEHVITFLGQITQYEMTNDELSTIFLNEQNTSNFKSMQNQIKLNILTRTLKSLWTVPEHRLRPGRIYLKNLLNNGWTFTKVNEMLENIKTNIHSFESLSHFLDSLSILTDYKIDDSIINHLNKIFSTSEAQLWPSLVHTLAIENRIGTISLEKNLATLLAEIDQVNNSQFSKRLTQTMQQIDAMFKNDSLILKQNEPINNWSKLHIQNWTNAVLHQNSQNFVQKHLPEIMAIIKRAVYLDSNFEPRYVQLLALLIILDPEYQGGRLLQILTGEGKTIVVSILAVIKALERKHVDIVTSSITLAKRDAQERQNFYAMFKLTVSHNNDEATYVTGPKSCYRANIVYGNSSQFQFDILRHEFSLLNTREHRRYDVVIIDEVDSMLIDGNNTIARLADHSPGIEWLNPLVYGIWRCVNTHSNPGENRDLIVEQIKFLIDDVESQLKVPTHLHRFALDSVPLWVDHAIRAKIEYRLDHHYMIKADETGTKLIVPIDYSNTGVVQSSTTWSDGLHQFLQIKHGLKMTSLTLTTNYLSNIGLFTRYNDQIYGFTGTIGSQDAQDLLHKIYNVKTIIIPPFKQKRHFQFDTILAPTNDEWLKSIISNTMVHVNQDRAVLIICETRLDAKTITKQLQRTAVAGKIRLYTDNTDTLESNVVLGRIQPREIIVATNLAGRGTDLKTSREVEKNGGLHVCLTFLSNNLRVEEQALGRTSRQGNRGTSQMILNQDQTHLRLMSCYPEYLNDDVERLSDRIAYIRDWREKAEVARLERIWTKDVPEIREKDHLFQQFCELLSRLRQQKDDFYCLSSVKERWGLWLKSMDHAIQNRKALETRAKDVGFRCVEMSRNADSWFHAVAHHFNGKQDANTIKTKLIKHIENNEELYHDIDEEQRHWATSRALNVNIVLVRSDYGGPCVYKCEHAKRTCFIGYEVDTHYVPLEPLHSKAAVEDENLVDLDADDRKVQESTSLRKNILHMATAVWNACTKNKMRKIKDALSTRIVHSDLRTNFVEFRCQIQEEYMTDKIIQNPCYLMMEANEIIVKRSSLLNRVRSHTKHMFSSDKQKTSDDAIRQLKRAVELDPVFAFGALVHYAYLIIDKRDLPKAYKETAKSHLIKAQENIGKYIIPQLHSMQLELKNKQIDQFIYDDFVKQTQMKVEILHTYLNYIDQAISIIESSQELIDVSSKIGHTVTISRKLYRNEAEKFVSSCKGVIKLSFHSLTVHEDFIKYDQALTLLNLLPHDYQHISIDYVNTDLETMKKISSDKDVTVVYFNIQYLNGDEVLSLVDEKDRADLIVTGSSEQSLKVYSNWVIQNTDFKGEPLSENETLRRINDEAESVKSICFESIDRKTAETIVTNVTEKVAFSLTFNQLPIARMINIVENASKPFSFQLRNLTKTKASNFINKMTERNFVVSLHQLQRDCADRILKKFDRNGQDVRASLKPITEQYINSDKPSEELSTDKNMSMNQLIIINELSPRPWISASLTASIGVGQIIGGVCLAAVTCGLGGSVGIPLITEGVCDIFYAIKGAITRQFSWKDYIIQKGISLAICFASLGFSTITTAAKAERTSAQTTWECVKQTVQEAGNSIKNSARIFSKGAVQGTAKASWELACQQVIVTVAENGLRELAEYSVNVSTDNILLPVQSAIRDEIERIINVQQDNKDYDYILHQALINDTYYNSDQWQREIETIAMKLLTKQKNEFVEIVKSLGKNISNVFLRHANQLVNGTSNNGKMYVNIAQKFLTMMPVIKSSHELFTITDKFFAAFNKDLVSLKSKIPTFADLLVHASVQSISATTATEIHQLLIKHHILNDNNTIIIPHDLEDIPNFIGQWDSSHSQIDPPVQSFDAKLVSDVNTIPFLNRQHKDYALIVLKKLRQINQKSSHIVRLRKKIVELLVNQIVVILHGTIDLLATRVIQSAIIDLSTRIQLKIHGDATVNVKLEQEAALRLMNVLSNDLVQNFQTGKISLSSDTIKKLNDFVKKCADPNFKPSNFNEEIAFNILNGKQGGIIEIGILAAITGKPISVIQQQAGSESAHDGQTIRLIFIPPCIDNNTGKVIEGHYEIEGGNVISKGQQDCLYAAVLSKTSDKFRSIEDMRNKCAAFILTNSDYITGIIPAINIINASRDPIRRKQLMMEGGRYIHKTERFGNGGGLNWIPVLSQLKSGVQWLCGDSEGARRTQEDFLNTCPLVSQVKSLVEYCDGNKEAAKQTQWKFLYNASQMVDGIPVVGHIKGGIHYACGDKEGGDNTMKSASHATGVYIGGAAGFVVGGPLGAVAGGVAGGIAVDGITTAVDSAVHGEYRPSGNIALATNIYTGESESKSGDALELISTVIMDGVGGYYTGKMVGKALDAKQNKTIYRIMPEEDAAKAVQNKQLASSQPGPTGEVWTSESVVRHQRSYLEQKINKNPGVNYECCEIKLNRKWYDAMKKNNAIDQNKCRAINRNSSRPKNLINNERLKDHPQQKVNVGFKGEANLKQLNENVVSIKKIDPNSWKYNNQCTKHVAKYGLTYAEAVACGALQPTPTSEDEDEDEEKK